MSANAQIDLPRSKPTIKSKRKLIERSIDTDKLVDKVEREPNTVLRAAIEQAAYFRAEARGFVPGHELEDWVAAEADIVGQLASANAR